MIRLVALLVGLGFLAMVGLTVFDFVARPGLRRLAIRNIARRPTEALLVVLGSMLGTAIITAALIVGDTFENSIVDIGRRELGPIDLRVTVDGLDRGAELEAALAGLDDPLIDGVLAMRTSGAAAATVEQDRRAEPFSSIAEVDFDAVRAFGGNPAATGFSDAGPTPVPGQVVISERLADELGVGFDDQVEFFAYGQSVRMTVLQVLSEVGVAGYVDAFVPPGTIASLIEAGADTAASPPTVSVLLSGLGGVYDGADHSSAIEAAVERVTSGIADVEIQPIKAELLADARAEGDGIGQLFTMIGSFSVLVGILLLVNLFVMLSEERKQELGVLRAVGFKRSHLLRSFGLEGAIYAVLAAATGGVFGVGVGWVIGRVTQRIEGVGSGQTIVFAVDASSVITGMVLGLVISLVTVWLTSARIARLNVIRAIRDLPEPGAGEPTLRSTVLASAGVGLGLLMAQAGFSGDIGVGMMAGVPVALLSSIPILRRFLGQGLAILVPSSLSLLWGLTVFSFASTLNESGVEVFVTQGIVLVGSGVLLLSTASPVWKAMTVRLASNGRGLSAHLALAYPLARRVRTGILLAMFSLTIFVMTFMSMFGQIFSGQAETFSEAARGGFDVYVDSNWSNPVSAEQLAGVAEVTAVAPIARSFPEFSSEYQTETMRWSVSGFDHALVDGGVPDLKSRLPGLDSDDAVYQAILDPVPEGAPAKAIVPEFFLSGGNGPPDFRPTVGMIFTMHSPFDDRTMDFEVIGINDSDFLFNGLLTSRAVVEPFLGPALRSGRFYVGLAEGVDAETFTPRLDGAFIPNGVQSDTFLAAVQERMAERESFMQLLQGYLGLGLVIGVAGLGVVMVRAVRERRRQVGILRAMGFKAATVRAAYLIEAGFIASQGIVLGIGLGVLTAYQVLVNSEAFGGSELPFSIPWLTIAVILGVPLGASLLATVTPAAQAAAIRPAEALRLAD